MNNKELTARFWFCLLFSLPFLAPQLDSWIQWVLASVILFVGARDFFEKSYRVKPNRYTLITLALGLAYLGSFFELLLSSTPQLLFSQVAFVTCALNLGLIFEEQIWELHRRPKKAFLALLPVKAHKLFEDGHFEDVSVNALTTGDCVRVLENELLPVDGVIISGTTLIDESFLSGNKAPVTKGFGETVYAGTTNQKEAIMVKSSQVGKSTLIAKSQQLLPKDAPKTEIASFLIPAAVILALVSFLFGLAFSSFAFAILHACSVLLIAAPGTFDSRASILSQAIYLGAMQGLIFSSYDSLNAPSMILQPGQKAKTRLSKLVNGAIGLINQNLFLAYAYNIVGLGIALFGNVPPSTATLAMILATLFISLNASRLANKVQ